MTSRTRTRTLLAVAALAAGALGLTACSSAAEPATSSTGRVAVSGRMRGGSHQIQRARHRASNGGGWWSSNGAPIDGCRGGDA